MPLPTVFIDFLTLPKISPKDGTPTILYSGLVANRPIILFINYYI